MRVRPSTSQVARMQRGVALALVIAAGGLAAALWVAGFSPFAAGTAAAAVLFGHAWVLALEFVLLSRVDPGAGVMRPRAHELVRAWWGEVGTGLLVFGWRQPYLWHRIPDQAEPAQPMGARRGVVLVHGFVCNRGLWNPWMARFRAMGVPYAAVNLEPVFADIDSYVRTIDAAVGRVHSATGQPPLIVAHSMGGLAVRAWLRRHQADHRMHAVVTIASPHHGTGLARFAVSANTRQMMRGNAWLADLASQEQPGRRARFTCFFGHADNIVFPAATATLEGADNRHLPGVAHVHMVYQPAVWNEVCRQLAAPPAAVA